MKEVETEVDQGSRQRRAVEQQMPLREVKAARSNDQRRVLVREAIALAGCGVVVGNRASHRVTEVDLAVDDVRPAR
jgi:hypothetical protein